MAYRRLRRGAGRLFDNELNRMLQELYGNMKIAHAERVILSTYGDTVSVEEKAKDLFKFGRNASVGTSSVTVWDANQDETFATTNAIDTISSSNASDTQEIAIEGHTVSGTGADAQFTFVVQTATLNGQSKVTLDTPLARCSRLYVNSNAQPAGDIYVYQDDTISGGVPTTSSKIHNTILGSDGFTQSYKCASTISNTDYYIVTGGYAAVAKKTAASADFTFQVRRPGGVFRPAGGRIALQSGGQTTAAITFDPYVIVPKNSDFRVVASASTTNVEVDATIQGYLAKVI